jgi:hypothetical protein
MIVLLATPIEDTRSRLTSCIALCSPQGLSEALIACTLSCAHPMALTAKHSGRNRSVYAAIASGSTPPTIFAMNKNTGKTFTAAIVLVIISATYLRKARGLLAAHASTTLTSTTRAPKDACAVKNALVSHPPSLALAAS